MKIVKNHNVNNMRMYLIITVTESVYLFVNI